MKKLLLFLSLLLYMIGCGDGKSKSTVYYVLDSDKTSLTSSSIKTPQSDITAQYDTDHVSISEISALFVEGIALDIDISDDGNFAYIATGDKGLSVVNISDPYNPELISTNQTQEYVNSVIVKDSIAYVGYKSKEWNNYVSINIFDISDPYSVKYTGFIDGFRDNNHKLSERDDMIYFVDNQGIKIVLNGNYNVIGRYDLFDTAYALALRKNFIFIANGRNGLTILKTNALYNAKLTK